MATADVTVWCDDADDWGESRYGGPQSYSLLRVEHVTSTAHVAATTQRVRWGGGGVVSNCVVKVN